MMPFHDLVKDFVTFYGRLDISHENLKTGPKCTEGIHEMFRVRVRAMHVDVL